MIKAYHVTVLHFVNDFLSVVPAQVVHVHNQFDLPFSSAQILHRLLHIRHHNANDVVLRECLIWVKSIDQDQLFTPKTAAIITFEVLIALLAIRSTSSGDKGYMEVSWYL
jgi:hypothetical protein